MTMWLKSYTQLFFFLIAIIHTRWCTSITGNITVRNFVRRILLNVCVIFPYFVLFAFYSERVLAAKKQSLQKTGK